MRAVPARKCSKFAFGPDQQMGIIRYNTDYINDTSAPDPLSEPPLYDIACADEPYEKLVPHRHWIVGDPKNIGVYIYSLAFSHDPLLIEDSLDPTQTNHSALHSSKRYIFDVGMVMSGGPGTNTPYIPDDQPYVSPPNFHSHSISPLPRIITFF